MIIVTYSITDFLGVPFTGSNDFVELTPLINPGSLGKTLATNKPKDSFPDGNGSGSFVNIRPNYYTACIHTNEQNSSGFFFPINMEFPINVPFSDVDVTYNLYDLMVTTIGSTATASLAPTIQNANLTYVKKTELPQYFTGSGVTVATTDYGTYKTLTLSANAGGLNTGSTYPITASWAVTSSYALNATATGGGSNLITGSTVPITASVALTALAGGTQLATGSLVPITSSQALTASYVGTGTSGFLPAWTSGSILSATSSVFQQSGLIGINNTSPSVKLDVKGGTTSETILRVGSSTGDVVLLGQNQFAGGPFIQVNDNANTSKILLQGAGDATFTNTGNVVLHPGKYVIVQGSVDGTRDTGIQFTGSNGDGTWMMDIDGFTGFDGGVISTTIAPSGDARFVGDVTASQFLSNRITSSLFGTSSVAIKALTSTSASYSTFAQTFPAALTTGSTYQITSSWAARATLADASNSSTSASYSFFASTTPAALPTGSTQNITSSWAVNSNSGSAITSSANTTLYLDLSNTGSGLSPTYTNLNLYYNPATGSLYSTIFSGSQITGSLFGTSSYSISSSYATFAQTLPAVLVSGSTYNITSSWATNSKSASFIGTGSNNTIPKWSNNILVGSNISDNGSIITNNVPISVTSTTATVLSSSVSIGSTTGVTDVMTITNADPGNNQIFSISTPNYKDPFLAIKDNLQTYVVNISPTGSVQFQNSASVTVGPNSGRFKLEVSGSIGPNQSGSFDLGSSVYTWRNIFGGLTGSHFGTSSYAINSVNAPGSSGTTLFTASTYQITSSWANNAISSSFAQTASYLSSPQRYIFQTTGSGLVGGITASFSESVCWIPIGVANKSYAVTCSNMPTNNQDYGSMMLVLDQTSTTNSGSAFTWPANFQWLGTGGKTNSPTFFTGSCRAKVFLECYVSGSIQNILGTPII